MALNSRVLVFTLQHVEDIVPLLPVSHCFSSRVLFYCVFLYHRHHRSLPDFLIYTRQVPFAFTLFAVAFCHLRGYFLMRWAELSSRTLNLVNLEVSSSLLWQTPLLFLLTLSQVPDLLNNNGLCMHIVNICRYCFWGNLTKLFYWYLFMIKKQGL